MASTFDLASFNLLDAPREGFNIESELIKGELFILDRLRDRLPRDIGQLQSTLANTASHLAANPDVLGPLLNLETLELKNKEAQLTSVVQLIDEMCVRVAALDLAPAPKSSREIIEFLHIKVLRFASTSKINTADFKALKIFFHARGLGALDAESDDEVEFLGVNQGVSLFFPDLAAPAEEAAASTEAPAEEAAASTTEAPVEEAAASTEAPAEEAAASTTEAPAEEAAASTTEAPVEEAAASTTEAPVEEAAASTTEAPAVNDEQEPYEQECDTIIEYPDLLDHIAGGEKRKSDEDVPYDPCIEPPALKRMSSECAQLLVPEPTSINNDTPYDPTMPPPLTALERTDM